jgi:hypothetical protein
VKLEQGELVVELREGWDHGIVLVKPKLRLQGGFAWKHVGWRHWVFQSGYKVYSSVKQSLSQGKRVSWHWDDVFEEVLHPRKKEGRRGW